MPHGRRSPQSSTASNPPPPDHVRRICVYCGSSKGARRVYADAARQLADLLAAEHLELVYGGASKGIMGIIADRMLEHGGTVHGVIPKSLYDQEIAHQGLSELHVVGSMHERKSLMVTLSDGFIAMPGGFGTLEEIIESVTWGQLRFHDKPCGLLNVDGYFDGLLDWLDHAVSEGFLRAENRRMLLADDDPAALLARFRRYRPPEVEKWQ